MFTSWKMGKKVVVSTIMEHLVAVNNNNPQLKASIQIISRLMLNKETSKPNM